MSVRCKSMAYRLGIRAVLLTASVLVPSQALAQGGGKPAATPSTAKAANPPLPEQTELPEWMSNLVPAFDTPAAQSYAKAQRIRVDSERELKKIRAQYFRQTRNTEIRQLGILKIRQYTDPALFPTLLKLFEGEGADVEYALFDHFRDLKLDEADAALAWAAVFGQEKDYRVAAGKRLLHRTEEVKGASNRVQWVISLGLRHSSEDAIVAAAQLASTLNVFEAIPMLINAQVGGGPPRSSQEDDGSALAYILVGTQEAFVSGLTPIVGDNAVAFNPQLSVLTTGTIIRVIDAVVITYRIDVYNALVALSTKAWGGRSTAQLGWDQVAWREWYTKTLLPYRAQLAGSSTQPTEPAPKP